MALLAVRGLTAQYGWTRVLHGVDFSVEAGGITTILGANGAGKTTTLRAVSGMIRTSGEIAFDGRSSPEIVFAVVVLPAPLAPSRHTSSPAETRRLTPRSTSTLP